jgi:hypothetical protein
MWSSTRRRPRPLPATVAAPPHGTFGPWTSACGEVGRADDPVSPLEDRRIRAGGTTVEGLIPTSDEDDDALFAAILASVRPGTS